MLSPAPPTLNLPSFSACSIWQAGVHAVLGDVAIRRHVELTDASLRVGERRIPRGCFDRVIVVGGGKATAAMATGLLHQLGSQIPIRGWINVPEGTADDFPSCEIRVCQARPAGVNEPTDLAVQGTQAILEAVSSATERDLCLVLLSGGGSALLVAPAEGISLADKLAVTRHLSSSGAAITELNTVRKHLSRVKGDRLRQACRASRLVTLVLSDVIGDPLDMIASGPTIPDTTTPADALAVLDKYDPARTLPLSIYRCLERALIQTAPPSTASESVIIANHAAAVEAAAEHAQSLGYTVQSEAATAAEGSAESVGQQLANRAVELLRRRSDSAGKGHCLVTGGEPVVRLAPAEVRGKGGRNQQLVLAAMIALQQHPDFCAEDRERLMLLSGGTDGEDGPTDAAGAVLNAAVWQACEQQALVPLDYLRRNDAYTFFAKTGGLMLTGPTGTNVCDLRVLTVDVAASS